MTLKMSTDVKNICRDANISGKTIMNSTKFGLCYIVLSLPTVKYFKIQYTLNSFSGRSELQ